MPRIVDHDQRRGELTAAALRLIAKSGIGAVTTRAVSAEAGWSTGVLGHYFDSRETLLLGTLRHAAAEQGAVYAEIASKHVDDPMAALTAIVDSVLPGDRRRLAMTRIFLFFYAQAAADEPIREEIAGYLDRWRTQVRDAVSAAGSQDPDNDARFILALTDGYAMHAVLAPPETPMRGSDVVARWVSKK